jgi:metal-responsive CopG/Arc/MetJ family transcriptional regulator
MKSETKPLTVRFPVALIDEIERIAKKRNLATSQVVRMCLDLGVECHKDMEKVGLIGVVDFAYYVSKALKDNLSSIKGKQLSLL